MACLTHYLVADLADCGYRTASTNIFVSTQSFENELIFCLTFEGVAHCVIYHNACVLFVFCILVDKFPFVFGNCRPSSSKKSHDLFTCACFANADVVFVTQTAPLHQPRELGMYICPPLRDCVCRGGPSTPIADAGGIRVLCYQGW